MTTKLNVNGLQELEILRDELRQHMRDAQRQNNLSLYLEYKNDWLKVKKDMHKLVSNSIKDDIKQLNIIAAQL